MAAFPESNQEDVEQAVSGNRRSRCSLNRSLIAPVPPLYVRQKEMAIETPNPAAVAESDKPNKKWLPEFALTAGMILMTVVVGRMIYHDSFVDGSTYSNRSFALPAAGFSVILVVYACVRLSFLPLWLRLVGAPFAVFAGYLGIGLMLILINAAI